MNKATNIGLRDNFNTKSFRDSNRSGREELKKNARMGGPRNGRQGESVDEDIAYLNEVNNPKR